MLEGYKPSFSIKSIWLANNLKVRKCNKNGRFLGVQSKYLGNVRPGGILLASGHQIYSNIKPCAFLYRPL
jgi:hypothetical protein